MRVHHQIAARWRELVQGRRVDHELTEELRFHVERQTEANLAAGMSPTDARRAARLLFGSVDDAAEASRAARSGAGLRQLGRDARHGARLLAKSPGFALAAVGVVLLGVGAVTAIFTVAYGMLLRPLPYPESERLVTMWTNLPTLSLPRAQVNAADYDAWRAQSRSFEDIALVRHLANFNFTGDGEPERLYAARVSTNLFRVLRVTPAIGRTFTEEEGTIGREQVVLLSDGFWRRRFGADPRIVGRTIRLSGVPHEVVGVMRPDFRYPEREHQIWVPLTVDPRERSREAGGFNYRAVARLKPGTTVEAAQREMTAIATRLQQSTPETNEQVGFVVDAMLADAVRDVRPALYVLLGAVACLLLIACLNLGNLLGARAASRGGELAVRLALGASRVRLVAQLVAEVVPIVVIGGALGVGAGWLAVRAFVASAPPSLPRLEVIALNGPVLAVAALALLVTALVASIIPARQAWRSDFATVTKEGGRAVMGGRGQARTRQILVAAQIAFAVPLLVGAGLLLRSFDRLLAVDPGFRTDGVLSVLLAVPRSKYTDDAKIAAVETRMLEAVRALPGVRSAGMVNRLPLGGVGQVNTVQVERGGETVQVPSVDSRSASADYFQTMGIALLEGRAFDARDAADAPMVVLVDEQLARTMWPGQSAVGKRLRFPSDDAPWCTVVGVVRHIRHDGLETEQRPQVYWHYPQRPQDRMAMVVRTDAPAALAPAVVRAIRTVDSEQAVYEVRPMEEVLRRSIVQRRTTTRLFTAFASIALVLASVGVYGVIALGVTQRRRELGVRVALGASPRTVARLVVQQGGKLAAAGAAVGLLGAWLLSGSMQRLVFGVDPRDAASFLAAPAALVAIALVASWLPARRAAKVDPMIAMRGE